MTYYFHEMKKRVKEEERIKHMFETKSSQENRRKIVCKKPKIYHNYSEKPIELKTPCNLGPGHYDLDLSTIKRKTKRPKHQFFNSTEKRFRENNEIHENTSYCQSPTSIINQKIKTIQHDGSLHQD